MFREENWGLSDMQRWELMCRIAEFTWLMEPMNSDEIINEETSIFGADGLMVLNNLDTVFFKSKWWME